MRCHFPMAMIDNAPTYVTHLNFIATATLRLEVLFLVSFTFFLLLARRTTEAPSLASVSAPGCGWMVLGGPLWCVESFGGSHHMKRWVDALQSVQRCCCSVHVAEDIFGQPFLLFVLPPNLLLSSLLCLLLLSLPFSLTSFSLLLSSRLSADLLLSLSYPRHLGWLGLTGYLFCAFCLFAT